MSVDTLLAALSHKHDKGSLYVLSLHHTEKFAMQVHWVTSVMIMRQATRNRQYKEVQGITQALQVRPANSCPQHSHACCPPMSKLSTPSRSQ